MGLSTTRSVVDIWNQVTRSYPMTENYQMGLPTAAFVIDIEYRKQGLERRSWGLSDDTDGSGLYHHGTSPVGSRCLPDARQAGGVSNIAQNRTPS